MLRKILPALAIGSLAALCLLGIGAAGHLPSSGWLRLSSLRSGSQLPPTPSAGWGIDACLSCHVPGVEVPGYLRLLRSSDIRWLRERGIGPKTDKLKSRNLEIEGPLSAFQRLASPVFAPLRLSVSEFPAARVWAAERRAGFRVVAFASPAWPVPVEDPVDQLPEDLLAVYRAFRETARATAGEVDAWEMVGEPETFYCKDLPDRVAAFQKAVYLGLKDGPKAETISESQHFGISAFPVVLNGALAFPPGPWLEAAAENGFFDYTDAINVHHYGFAKDLGDVIAAHRAIAARWTKGRTLPVWVTEVGLNNIPKADWRNAVAREAQADYLIECATAAIKEGVAVFMPFILVHRGDPFAMTETANDVHPAWTRYRDFTRNHSLDLSGPVAMPPPAPNPIVLQWLPDTATCTPSKISRSYWFESDGDGGWDEIEGEIRVYNFSGKPVRVRLMGPETLDPRLALKWAAPVDAVTIAPMSRRAFALTIALSEGGYLRSSIRYRAETLGGGDQIQATSPLAFSVETMPEEDIPHRELPLAFGPAPDAFHYVGGAVPFVSTSRSASVRGLNGVSVVKDDGTGEFVFDVKETNENAVTPPQAILSLPNGLPAAKAGFLRLQATDSQGRPASGRVDLVDGNGQRFSIVEGLGRNPLVNTGDTVLLGYANFHPWVFGNCRPGVGFDPKRVRELQLRFCDAGAGKRFRVHLDALDFGGR